MPTTDNSKCLIAGVDPYAVFVKVAEHGGSAAVTTQGLWRQVALSWRPELDGTPRLGKV